MARNLLPRLPLQHPAARPVHAFYSMFYRDEFVVILDIMSQHLFIRVRAPWRLAGAAVPARRTRLPQEDRLEIMTSLTAKHARRILHGLHHDHLVC